MAEGGDSQSTLGVSEIGSSSGIEDCNVVIFFHKTINKPVLETERILLSKGLTSCLEHRDGPAYRTKLANVWSAAKHGTVRAFIITRRFLDEDFKYYESLLDNPALSTMQNTLFIMRKSQENSIPERMKSFQRKFLKDAINGEDIASFIEEFYGTCSAQDRPETTDENTRDRAKGESDDEEGIVTDQEFRKYDAKLSRFKQRFGNFDKKMAYILITSQIQAKYPGLRNITLIPWVKVFDFDRKSRISGLLSTTEQVLTVTRYHTKRDRTDSVEIPEDETTDWIFINGCIESMVSVQPENQRIPEDIVYQHCVSLVEYSIAKKVPSILVMWYPTNSNMNENLDILLSGMRHHFMGRLRCFNCIICTEKLPDKHSRFYEMLRRLNLLDDLLVVPLVILCHWLKVSLRTGSPSSLSKFTKTLPKYPDEGTELITTAVDDHELQWLEVHFHVLAMPDTYDEEIQNSNVGDKREDGLKYLKGKDISWNVIEMGEYDVTRDLLQKAKNYILEKRVRKGQSGLLTICHSPGGGGSTFAKRLLWEIRAEVPCVELKSDQTQRLLQKELVPRLMSIRNLTRLPTVILLDGKSMQDLKRIMAVSRKLRLIIVHVQRYYDDIDEPSSDGNKFYLPARVSKCEAEQFCSVYVQASKVNKSRLESLTEKIKRDENHFIFEYGLTAFESAYAGVIRYVHGYLQIAADIPFESWHIVLGFLAMANYYGHRGLPSKLFGRILNKADSETVGLEDLPHNARQFISEEDQCNWKITHYVVGKVIMEELFVKRTSTDYELDKKGLTPEAAENLSQWALKFIDNVKVHVGNVQSIPNHIYDILTAIFIKRNYKDPGENELDRNKPSYSKLLEDTNSKKCQCDILTKLVESFPEDPEFRAHLGRFYSKQADFAQAEKCFERAITIRRNMVYENPGHRGDDVLERIYNMSGFCNMSHIRHKIGVRLGGITERKLLGKQRPALIRTCLQKAKNAIDSFDNGRNWYQNGSNPSFANLGELKVRLVLTELANVIGKANYQNLLNDQAPYKELGDFAMQSFHECEKLLTYCIRYSHRVDVPEQELNDCLNLFNNFYSGATVALQNWSGNDSSIRSKQCHLTLLKRKLSADSQSRGTTTFRDRLLVSDDDAVGGEQARKLVKLYEDICDQVHRSQTPDIRISTYMMEWLQAIRYKNFVNKCTQADVLARVTIWKDRKETGSLGNFYYYVLTTLLSLFTVSRDAANVFSEKSCKAKEKLIESNLIRLYLLDTNEWLGRHEDPHDFKRLISSSSLGEWKGKFWTNREQINRLEICTGTIFYSKPHDGKIIIDGGHVPSITVFFVPQKYGLGGSHSKQRTRVEFYVGFNPRHGAEAYEVTPLNKFPCPNKKCKNPTEISMLGKSPDQCTSCCYMCETIVKANV